MASTFADLAGFIAKNGLPVLAAGETMGKVAADFVDVIVNDFFMPSLYKIIVSFSPHKSRPGIDNAFRNVKKEIDVVLIITACLKFFFAVFAVYLVLGVLMTQFSTPSPASVSTSR